MLEGEGIVISKRAIVEISCIVDVDIYISIPGQTVKNAWMKTAIVLKQRLFAVMGSIFLIAIFFGNWLSCSQGIILNGSKNYSY